MAVAVHPAEPTHRPCHFLGQMSNRGPTDCSLIVKEERNIAAARYAAECEIKERRRKKDRARVREQKRSGLLLVLPRPEKTGKKWRRLPQKSCSTLVLKNWKGSPQSHKTSSGKDSRSSLYERKRNRAIRANHNILRRKSQDRKGPHLGDSME